MSAMDMMDDDSLRGVPMQGKLLTLTQDFKHLKAGEVVEFAMEVWGTWFVAQVGVTNEVLGVDPAILTL